MNGPPEVVVGFGGFGGADLGIEAAGCKVVASIEIDPQISEVARGNGLQSVNADILTVDWSKYIGVWGGHFSPPCPNFSLAKTGRGEKPLDIAFAKKICEFIEVVRPKVLTIENVWLYRQSKSWRMIENTLFGEGYLPDVQLLNAADFGVPQTRKRMIVRAVRGEMAPGLPQPVPWIGWYEAIADLIPTLPESQFAPWQLARLPAELRTFLLPGGGNTNFDEAHPGKGCRYECEPSLAVTTVTGDGGSMPRAFLVDRTGTDAVNIEDPSPAITASYHSKTAMPRAFLVHPTDQRTMPVVDRDEPVYTVTGNHGNGNMPRAFLVDHQNATREATVSLEDTPSFTITAGAMRRNASSPSAWLSAGKVVKMTPRALARFQTFPDSYELPASASLACKGIGNACPPLLMQRIYEQFEVNQ